MRNTESKNERFIMNAESRYELSMINCDPKRFSSEPSNELDNEC
jgi:hypothetical protein